MLTLQFGDGRMPSDLSRYGDVLELKEPEVKLRVERDVITDVLSAVLAEHEIEDVSVEDPPLEEVIAEVFSQADGVGAGDGDHGERVERVASDAANCFSLLTLNSRHSSINTSMLARAQTWWTILRISLEERLVYRGDFWLGTLMRFLPIVTQVFLWGAVFAGMGVAAKSAAVGPDRRVQLSTTWSPTTCWR